MRIGSGCGVPETGSGSGSTPLALRVAGSTTESLPASTARRSPRHRPARTR
ncbi:hypothetical protein SSAG_02673 [Streptomyces sp. Mg1]|nr:hypothetical protein SSAG_02673 [Streptomyces sp. Mg1]